MVDDSAAEFEWFQALQNKLIKVFLAENYTQHEAEEASVFLAQAIRNVPSLLRLLDEFEECSIEEIMEAVHDVLANRFALQDAATILIPNRTNHLSE